MIMIKKIQEKLKLKIRSRAGFSLAELLIAVLIMLMVSGVVAAGIPAAVNAYTKVTDSANAQMLLSTTMTKLREEISTATDIKVTEKKIEYLNSIGARTEIYLQSSASGEQPADPAGSSQTDKKTPGIYIKIPDVADYDQELVSKAVGGGNLYISYGSIEYSNNVVTFSGLKVKKINDVSPDTGSVGLAEQDKFSVRVLANAKE